MGSTQQVRTLGMILAGGRGTRLHPLTLRRTKPAVPFGSKYRIIDFAINNMINSGIFGMYLLTQFKAQSLTEHVQRNWRFGGLLADHFIILAPAQMYLYEQLGAEWYRGTADAIYQNLHLIKDNRPDLVAIFSGDHIYKMDIRHMIAYHREKGAEITIAAYPTPIEQATEFGVLQVDRDYRLTDFQEKPERARSMPGRPDHALTSMGNYIFSTESLINWLLRDARQKNSKHDFGLNVLPMALAEGARIMAYDFMRNPVPGQEGANSYWRDVGTIDAFHEANMDLVAAKPEFDLHNDAWPLRTAAEFSPPAKFVHEVADRRGEAVNSLVAGGVIVSGSTVRESVLFRRARVNSFSLVERSVLFDHVTIGRHCVLRNVIVDKEVNIPPGTRIGVDPDHDRARGFTVTERGVVVVPKGYRFT